MKTSIIILLFTLFFISCGDNPVNNNNQSPNPTADTVTLLYKDSICLVDTSASFKDSIVYSNSLSIDTLYIDFTIFAYRVDVNVDITVDVYNIFHRNVAVIGSSWDSSYSLKVSLSSIPLPFLTKLLILRGGSQPNHLFSLRNIKLYYIRRS